MLLSMLNSDGNNQHGYPFIMLMFLYDNFNCKTTYVNCVNTKTWYRKEADLWAELGDEIPFG
jgi:hypothetical protein